MIIIIIYLSADVEKEAHLLELCRYIVLNPVRVGMVNEASQWEWGAACSFAFAYSRRRQ